jgi:hypothetical protein
LLLVDVVIRYLHWPHIQVTYHKFIRLKVQAQHVKHSFKLRFGYPTSVRFTL